jgi:UDP-N-acetylglucosamine--N-acetylmuramyl-(pentapeptide) pyrophosphoryl-undecaprenol N-acetylglucosamine transferase
MRVILTGGGTGGHIYPALALAKQIKEHHEDAEILYIGSGKGLEADIVPKAGFPFEPIEVSGFKRSLSIENLKTIYRFIKSVSLSKRIIRNFQADVVIGTGGYVCGPVVYAAAKLGIPTLIHEQNVIPGLTNKFLSR